MRVILLTVLISVASVTFGQTTKKQPYIFDNWVELNDSLKIGDSSNLKDYGKFMKVDTLSDGTYYFTVDTVADVTPHTTSLPYDSITDRPFLSTVSGYTARDSSNFYSIGGKNDTTAASLYIKGGIENNVTYLIADATSLECDLGDIFVVEDNSVLTTIQFASEITVGRIIRVIGRTSTVGANTTQIASNPTFILSASAGYSDPIILNDGVIITFISIDYNQDGSVQLVEISRSEE